MNFHPDMVVPFLELFDDSAEKIRAVPGCLSLELLQDSRYPNILSTYSLWDSEERLNAYRSSDLFLTTWRKTKMWFSAPPQAWSHESIRSYPAKSESV